MANFVRFGVSRVLTSKLIQSTTKKTKYSLAPSFIRLINTSSKPTQATTPTTSSVTPTTSEVNPQSNQNWISWGFDEDDEWTDRFMIHSTMFCSISVCFVLGGFVLAYQPDSKLVDWSQREAYLQLRYREENGLPVIDPNLIDPSKIKLPTDEELGDTEIII